MVRLTFRWLWIIAGWAELVVLTLPMYLLSYLPKSWLERFYPSLFHYWCRVFVHALGVDLRLHQKNARPLPAQYILIANHPSAFEDIGIPALFPVYCLAKAEVADWWIVGRISKAAGTLYVTRESRQSRNDAAEDIIRAITEGKNVALYPEGGCKDKRLYDSFRFGAFHISLKTSLPILPVFLHYESQDDFHWPDGVSLPRKILDFMTTRNNRVNYYVHDAFDPRDFENKEDYMAHVYDCYLAWQSRYLD